MSYENTTYAEGCVYAVEFGDVVKIGFTTDFNERLKSLKTALKYRDEKKRIGRTYCSKKHHYANRSEHWLHDKFSGRRVEGTELFRITFEEAEKAIKQVEHMKLYSDEEWDRHLEKGKQFGAFVDYMKMQIEAGYKAPSGVEFSPEVESIANKFYEENKNAGGWCSDRDMFFLKLGINAGLLEIEPLVNKVIDTQDELIDTQNNLHDVMKNKMRILMGILVGLCNDEEYLDWLLNNEEFRNQITNDYSALTTEMMLKSESKKDTETGD